MKLLTKPILQKLLDNGRKQALVRGTEREHDFVPVAKLFCPVGAATWLLTKINPDDPDIAFGLCDLGVGCPELGSVSLAELRSIRVMGVGIERDLHWNARGALSAYADAANAAGHIVQLSDPSSVPAAATAPAGEGR
jgi:hypothetical protein